jgi:hypothetical protein
VHHFIIICSDAILQLLAQMPLITTYDCVILPLLYAILFHEFHYMIACHSSAILPLIVLLPFYHYILRFGITSLIFFKKLVIALQGPLQSE